MARTELASYSTKEAALKSEFQSDLKPVIPSSNTHPQPPGRMTTRSPHWQGAPRRSSLSPPDPDHPASRWPARSRGDRPMGVSSSAAEGPLHAAPLPVLPAVGEGPQAPSSLPPRPQHRTTEGPGSGLAETGGKPCGRCRAAAGTVAHQPPAPLGPASPPQPDSPRVERPAKGRAGRGLGPGGGREGRHRGG